uniref:Uncharacterized protein n=1 Tax=Hyaloperonospora arabidopsidis (strain Emoy2) TaxID=559515 RepID=M4BF48_HYAAE
MCLRHKVPSTLQCVTPLQVPSLGGTFNEPSEPIKDFYLSTSRPSIVSKKPTSRAFHLIATDNMGLKQIPHDAAHGSYDLTVVLANVFTSQFAASGNNDQATKTSKEPGDRPPYPELEVSCRGAQVKGERPSCRCVRYGRQRSVQTEREATTLTPRGERYGNSGCHPHLVPTILLQPSSYRPVAELDSRAPRSDLA